MHSPTTGSPFASSSLTSRTTRNEVEYKIKCMLDRCMCTALGLQTWTVPQRDCVALDDAMRSLAHHVQILERFLARISSTFSEDVLYVVIAIIVTTRHQSDLSSLPFAEGSHPRYVVNLPTIESMVQFLVTVMIRLLANSQDSVPEEEPRCEAHKSASPMQTSPSSSSCSILDFIRTPTATRYESHTMWDKMTFKTFLRQFGIPCYACINVWMTCGLPSDSTLFDRSFGPLEFPRHALLRHGTPTPCDLVEENAQTPDSPISRSSCSSDSITLFEWSPIEISNGKELMRSDDITPTTSDELSDLDFVSFDTLEIFPTYAGSRRCREESSPTRSSFCDRPSPAKRRRLESRSCSPAPPSDGVMDYGSMEDTAVLTRRSAASNTYLTVPEWTSGRHRQMEAHASSFVCGNIPPRYCRNSKRSRSGSPVFWNADIDDFTRDTPVLEEQTDTDEPDLWDDSDSELSDEESMDSDTWNASGDLIISQDEEPKSKDVGTRTSWLSKLWGFFILRR